ASEESALDRTVLRLFSCGPCKGGGCTARLPAGGAVPRTGACDRSGGREPSRAAGRGVSGPGTTRQGAAAPPAVAESRSSGSRSAAAGNGLAARERALVRASRRTRVRGARLEERRRVFPQGPLADAHERAAPSIAAA